MPHNIVCVKKRAYPTEYDCGEVVGFGVSDDGVLIAYCEPCLENFLGKTIPFEDGVSQYIMERIHDE